MPPASTSLGAHQVFQKVGRVTGKQGLLLATQIQIKAFSIGGSEGLVSRWAFLSTWFHSLFRLSFFHKDLRREVLHLAPPLEEAILSLAPPSVAGHFGEVATKGACRLRKVTDPYIKQFVGWES